jgi:hypothetical protein
MFYVYQYVDYNTLQPFYVGKGTGKRRFIHLGVAKKRMAGIRQRGRPSYCENKIIQILQEGREPKIEVLFETENEDEAYAFEEKLVDTLGRKGIEEGGILTNRARGGRGGRGWKMTNEMRQKLIERNRKPWSDTRKMANAKTQREKQIGVIVMTFQSPTGEIFKVKDWQEFLTARGLSYNLVRHAGATIKKGPNKGWSLVAKERFYNPIVQSIGCNAREPRRCTPRMEKSLDP